jgi:hypothetical protein
VPYASACELTRNNNYKIEDANHLTVCKPPAKGDQGYSRLLDVLKTCLEVKCLLLHLDFGELQGWK